MTGPTRRGALLLGLVLSTAGASGSGCTKPGPRGGEIPGADDGRAATPTKAEPGSPAPGQAGPTATPPSPSAPIQRATTPAVVLTPKGGGESVRVAVEVVRSDEERRRGLMYRQHLAPDAGMLFLFEEDEVHTFWMKNTLIPLDMIFIRSDFTVAGVVENAKPRTTTSRAIHDVSRYVLEVNGGWAKENGIGPGATLRFEHIPEAP